MTNHTPYAAWYDLCAAAEAAGWSLCLRYPPGGGAIYEARRDDAVLRLPTPDAVRALLRGSAAQLVMEFRLNNGQSLDK